MNAIQLLKDDHKKVRGLLSDLESTTPRGVKTRTQLLETIGRELRVHSKIEEEIFYPALKAKAKKGDDEKMYFEALEEHRAAGELVLPDLEKTDPGSDKFSGRAKVLKELVEHHADEEEKEMFPRARELLSAAELSALGERMAQRKQELLAGEPGIVAKTAGAVLDVIAPRDDEDDELRRSGNARARSSARNGDGARAR